MPFKVRTTPSPPRSLDDAITALAEMARAGGPTSADYGRLSSLITWGAQEAQRVPDVRVRLKEFWTSLGEAFMTDTMQGFGLHKPHGYAGDFEVIDRIHMRRISRDPNLARWDEFFHQQAAPKAVRNRAEVLAGMFSEACDCSGGVRILNVGSGPCRDISWWLAENPQSSVAIECVDRDAKAIEYAKRVLADELPRDRVRFTQRDVLRYCPATQYDLIWSAGLFDYLSDRLFVFLLKRLRSLCAPSGRVVVGNFSTENPSRDYMELFGEWYLHHRDADTLCRLATEAGATRFEITSEAEGVNLFLIVHA